MKYVEPATSNLILSIRDTKIQQFCDNWDKGQCVFYTFFQNDGVYVNVVINILMYISNNINKILIIFNNHYTQLLFNPLADNRKVRKNRLSNCHNCHSLFYPVLIFPTTSATRKIRRFAAINRKTCYYTGAQKFPSMGVNFATLGEILTVCLPSILCNNFSLCSICKKARDVPERQTHLFRI